MDVIVKPTNLRYTSHCMALSGSFSSEICLQPNLCSLCCRMVLLMQVKQRAKFYQKS